MLMVIWSPAMLKYFYKVQRYLSKNDEGKEIIIICILREANNQADFLSIYKLQLSRTPLKHIDWNFRKAVWMKKS